MTRKITRSVAKIYLGHLEKFELGNLDSKRDWGHAKDYVEVRNMYDISCLEYGSLIDLLYSTICIYVQPWTKQSLNW